MFDHHIVYIVIVFLLQANNYWVSVHYVKTLSGGGILDPDDTLNDVVDDREQVRLQLYFLITGEITALFSYNR